MQPWPRSLLRLALGAASLGGGITAHATAGYRRTAAMEGGDFFSHFRFFTGADPSSGFVQYVDEAAARSAGMLDDRGPGPVLMSAERGGVSSPGGRRSLRLQSLKTWTQGLFVLDLQHMPTGCGTWPAFWLCGPKWPSAGEIDILETTHTTVQDRTTLHTSQGCSMGEVSPSSFSGQWVRRRDHQPATDCFVQAAGQSRNQGCGVLNAQGSAGAPFNAAGGGVVAAEWDANGIRAWFFQRGHVPADLQARASPQPDSWGMPYARFDFGSACSAGHFHDHQIIFDLTFCGSWAGANFKQACPHSASSDCNAFVQHHPEALSEAYWLVNHLDVYEKAGRSSARNTSAFHGLRRSPRSQEQAPHAAEGWAIVV